MDTNYRSALAAWLPLAIASTALSLMLYGGLQQSYRSSLDDPQQQIAEDTARVVAAGVDPKVLAPQNAAAEISASLATWMAFYDASLAPQATTGLLHGSIPTLPAGVFETAHERGRYAFTWQPEPGVRQAVVIVPAGEKGFAVSGRNMRAVEGRIGEMQLMIMIGWAATMVLSFAMHLFAMPLARRIVR